VYKSVLDVLEYNAFHYGNGNGLVDESLTLSHKEILEKTVFVKNELENCGIRRNSIVAILLNKTVDSAIIFYALLALNATILPLENLSEKEITYEYLLANKSVKNFNIVDKISLSTNCIFIYKNEESPCKLFENIAYINSTSGSTGKKKYAATKWEALMTNTLGVCAALGLSSKTTYACLFPIHMHFHECLLRPLFVGGTAVLVESDSPQRAIDVMSKYGVTHILGTPAQLTQICHHNKSRCSNMEFIEVAGGALSLNTQLMISESFGCKVTRSWGSTETSGVCIIDIEARQEANYIGRAIKGYSLSVYNSDLQTEQSFGVGEMIIQSIGIVNEIIDGSNKISLHSKLHSTDVVEIKKSGDVYFLGRKNDVIKCAGNNIYPEEIRNAINKHPKVIDSIVLSMKDERMGEIPVAFIVTNEKIDFFEIRKHCMNYMPNWKLPKRILFASEMPLTSSGKADVSYIRHLFEME